MQSPVQRPLWQVYLIFLAPMVLSNFLQGFSGTLNGIYIGQMLGTHALAAVSGMFPIVFFFIALVIGLGAGASVLIGQAWGARETAMVKAITGATLTLGALVGLIAAVLGSLFARPALQVLGTPLDVLDEAVGYAQMMMLIMPLLLVFILYTQLLRGVSDTVSPLLALIVSTLVGLLLTPALIRGWIGLPPMGIQSAAYAGLAGNAAAMLFLVLRLRHKQHVMAPDRELLAALRLDRVILAKVLRIGLPTGLQMVVLSLSELVILALVNSHGSQATAAYGAVTQIVNYVQFPALSIAITASILGAQAIGAGRLERIGPILRTGLLINLCLTGALILLGYGSSTGCWAVHHRRRGAGECRAPAAHHALEPSGVRFPGGVRRDHARQRRGADAGDHYDLLCAVRRVADGVSVQRPLRPGRRLDGLSGDVPDDARLADRVLPAGVAA
jgi:putative MATE family efflux protein